jgi:hypothetical protein
MKSSKGQPREIGTPENPAPSWQPGFLMFDENGVVLSRGGVGRYYSESVLVATTKEKQDGNEI